MEKTASTPIQLFRGMTADELAALRAATASVCSVMTKTL